MKSFGQKGYRLSTGLSGMGVLLPMMIMTRTVMVMMTVVVVVVAECQRHKAKGQGSKGPLNFWYSIKE